MIEIVKDDEVAATADLTNKVTMPGPNGIGDVDLFYFKTIRLGPIVTFEHLAGKALVYWLDGAYLHEEGKDPIGPVRYIHGRSEVSKGKQRTAAVLLAVPHLSRELDTTEWLGVVPEIYLRYLGRSEQDA